MNDEISRRDWVVLMAGAGTASLVAPEIEAAEEGQQTPPTESCPYFDQPLYCKGNKYCE